MPLVSVVLHSIIDKTHGKDKEMPSVQVTQINKKLKMNHD